MGDELLLRVTVEVRVEPCEGSPPTDTQRIKDSVLLAIQNALDLGDGFGFTHPLESVLSLNAQVVVVAEDIPTTTPAKTND